MERQGPLGKPLNIASRLLALASRQRPTPPFCPGGGPMAARPPQRVLILQSGANASVDYYLRPRLQRSGLEGAIVDLDQDPSGIDLLQAPDLAVIICRYINSSWLTSLNQARERLSGIVYFVDDDLAAMMADQGLPWRVRGKVALAYGRHRAALEPLVNEVWASTPALASRFPGGARVVPPTPCDSPADPLERPPGRVIYHGTDVHGPERLFVLSIAKVFQTIRPHIRFEITGDARLQRLSAGLNNVDVVSQTNWPDYLNSQRSRSAAVFLAPMSGGLTNASRAPVKRFDAARLGACGVFADTEPYRSAVRHGVDGLLAPMEVSAWVHAISRLLENPDLRLAMARAARDQIADRFANPPGLPFSGAGG
ncbi:MAG: glycosyltransferase [Caulobacter sp.]|nr:glycosyltransferase [Caulobacter sp.]